MTELIRCDGCGEMREWDGYECLTVCTCMENDDDKTEQSEGPVERGVSCLKCTGLENALREVVATYMILDDYMETQEEVNRAVDVVLKRKWPSLFGN